VSETYTQLDQSAAALRQAQVACAAATPGTPELLRYEQQPIAILLASVPELARNIADAVLGPVLALPAPDRKSLLDTMRAWFAEHGSATATAARMHMHRNTVHYRLRRVETLTGRDFTKPTDVGELHLALESIRILALAQRDTTVSPPHERQARKSRTDAVRTSAVG
jgi:DNA-binding PucR family transcriptional regulator